MTDAWNNFAGSVRDERVHTPSETPVDVVVRIDRPDVHSMSARVHALDMSRVIP